MLFPRLQSLKIGSQVAIIILGVKTFFMFPSAIGKFVTSTFYHIPSTPGVRAAASSITSTLTLLVCALSVVAIIALLKRRYWALVYAFIFFALGIMGSLASIATGFTRFDIVFQLILSVVGIIGLYNGKSDFTTKQGTQSTSSPKKLS